MAGHCLRERGNTPARALTTHPLSRYSRCLQQQSHDTGHASTPHIDRETNGQRLSRHKKIKKSLGPKYITEIL